MTRLRATLSLDLDDAWTYVRASGRSDWERTPSVIPLVCERLVPLMAGFGQRLSLFVVARDVEDERNRAAVATVAAAGHEIACHSYDHRPDFAVLGPEELRHEILHGAAVLEQRLGVRTVGFRAPGYARHPGQLAILREAGFLYDGSSLPTFLGPLCRLYYFNKSGMSREERRRRTAMYGGVRDALAPNRAHLASGTPPLVNVPVTTFPVLRVPIHLSYVIWLAKRSQRLAHAYCAAALTACRLLRTEPSYLLHSLDLVGSDDRGDLGFFPGMDLPWVTKRTLLEAVVARLERDFELQTMEAFAQGTIASIAGGVPSAVRRAGPV